MKKEKIVLIDGHSILNRAFYGVPDLTNSEGLHTNAVYGFLNIMFKILDEEQADYLAVAFDLKAPTFRHKMYDAYKGTRKPMPEELHQQVPVIKEMLTAMGVPLMMLEGYEADDLLGTVSKEMEKKGLEVAVVSGDRDLLQLASDNICIRLPKTQKGGTVVEDYHPRDVMEKYQVTPLQIIELKALMGDSSDNIPGIPGVGEKTAAKIIAEYGSIENAYAHVEEIKPNKARESLRDHYDLAQMSKTLATINVNSPFELNLEDARIVQLYTPQALELCKKLEFKNMLSRFECSVEQTESRPEFTCITDLGEAEAFWQKAAGCDRVGFQILREKGRFFGAALCCGEKKAVYIPAQGFLTEEYLRSSLQELLKKAACAPTIELKEQLDWLCPEEKGMLLDASVGAYLLNPLKNEYTYDDLAKDYAGKMYPSRGELLGKLSLCQASEEQPEQFLDFACYQALTVWESWPVIWEQLQETEMDSLFSKVEMPLVFTLFDMEQAGILVRAEKLKEYGDRLQTRILELEKEIYEMADETFNINSPKQLGVILFEKLQMPYGKKTKTGYSTAADVLEKLAEEYPIVAQILEYRQLTKLKSTYADGLASFIEADGRIHSRFNQTITATGRISSTDPNLQNIPIRTELGRLLRKVFVPKDGYVFVDADYSQIELRVLAHVSADPQLIGAYREAQDIHAITASQVFHVPLEEVTPLLRRNAKAVNFGIVYGISSFGLSQGLSITRKEAQEYIEQYFKTYPGIKHFLDNSVIMAKEKGYALTLFGRRRPVPELKSSNFMQRSFGERVAMNSPIQGTAADIIKIAMVKVNQRLKAQGLQSRLLLQVHDELLVEAKKEEVAQVEEILRQEMMGAASLEVQLEIDMHTGDNWYDAH
ncbi:MAG: DNA polymerase I [Lachnospiraceae bacterium]|nr:DNA polymerase I [Lachnospiraceae bacterium]